MRAPWVDSAVVEFGRHFGFEHFALNDRDVAAAPSAPVDLVGGLLRQVPQWVYIALAFLALFLVILIVAKSVAGIHQARRRAQARKRARARAKQRAAREKAMRRQQRA